MSCRTNFPTLPVLNQVVAASVNAQSTSFSLGYAFSAQAAWLVNVAAGLTATFKVLVSMDNVNFYDSGQVLPSVSGEAAIFPVQYSGAFPFVAIQVIPTAGSAQVTITGLSKGGA